MKLKQRALVTGSMFLGMGALFLIGLLLSTRPENTPQKDKQRALPDIPGVPDYVLDERVNNPGNEDKVAVVDSLIARHNRSRGIPDQRKGRNRKNLDDLEQARDRKRRLQQKLESFKSTDELEKMPRGPELLNELVLQKLSPKDQVALQHQRNITKIRDGELKKEMQDESIDIEYENPLAAGERDPWKVWHSWVKQDHFYPEEAFFSEEMNSILHAMATYPITSFDVGHRGTQLKVSMFFGQQRTAFKPMRQVGNSVPYNLISFCVFSYRNQFLYVGIHGMRSLMESRMLDSTGTMQRLQDSTLMGVCACACVCACCTAAVYSGTSYLIRTT